MCLYKYKAEVMAVVWPRLSMGCEFSNYCFVISQLATILMFKTALTDNRLTKLLQKSSRVEPLHSLCLLFRGKLACDIVHIGRHVRLFENLQFPRLHNKEARRGTK